MRSLGLVATQTTLRSNLPAQVSSFIGRDGELADIARWWTGRGWSR
jgi:hypothetical protein